MAAMIEPDPPLSEEPRRPLSEREIISILDSYSEASISTRSSHLSKERAKALEFYNMEPYGNEKKTQSPVVTSEVFDTVETIATRLVKVFTSTDKAVEFVPEGPEDVDGADQKTKYANCLDTLGARQPTMQQAPRGPGGTG
jgi:hypothetical protein